MGFVMMNSMTNSPLIPIQVKKSFGYSFDQFFISCVFTLVDCKPEDWIWFYDSRFGNCFQFNSGRFENGTKAPIKTVSQTSMPGGLLFQLFVGDSLHQNSFSSYSVIKC